MKEKIKKPKEDEVLERENLLYRKSAYWRKLRLERLRKSKFKCWVCGKRAIHVHHIFLPRPYKEKIDVLLPLCKICHDSWHSLFVGYLPKKKNFKKKLLRWKRTISKYLTLKKKYPELKTNNFKMAIAKFKIEKFLKELGILHGKGEKLKDITVEELIDKLSILHKKQLKAINRIARDMKKKEIEELMEFLQKVDMVSFNVLEWRRGRLGISKKKFYSKIFRK